jgi:1-acyl-sn-glycerol-3-phosphate acyltransferase
MRILGFFLAGFRLLAFLAVTSLFISWYLIYTLFKGRDLDYILELRFKWMYWMFPILGIRPFVSGVIPEKTALLCSNHVSYIDPALILYKVKALAVAKIQVASWPFIGYVADLSGTVFVDRDDRNSTRSVRDTIISYLKKGYSVINFPEGTTTNQKETIDFKLGGFIGASENEIPIVPIALWYENENAPFIADEKFLPHFFRCFSVWRTNSYIHYCEAVYDENPVKLSEAVKRSIDRELKKIIYEKMA